MTTVIDLIISVYGREYPLKVTCGKFNKYLGMNIDFSEKGKVKLTVYVYIYNMLEELPEDTKKGESSTPAGYHLFPTNIYNLEDLSKKETIKFHNVT